MAGKCISLVKGRRIRLTKVNDCGIPVYGESNSVTSKGFISVAFTANSTESDEISVTNAAGEICVFEPSESSFTGYGVEITFCEVDVELFGLATGQQVYLDSNGNPIGFTVNTSIERTGGFALELWAGSPGADVCADPNAQGSYGYLLFPFIKGGIVGDFTIENGAATFTIAGSTTRDGNGWGTGPYSVVHGGSPINEVQRATITGTPTGGTFTLTYAGQTTTAIAYNATFGAVQTALEALSNIAPGDVVVSGGPGPATPYTFTFGGTLGNKDIAAMTAAHVLTGGTTPAIAITTITPGVSSTLAALPSALDPDDHMLMVVTTVAPPEAACGARPVLDPALPSLTSVAGVVTGLSVAFTVTPASTGPVWYDFGDGEWDYVVAPGTATHVYAAAGAKTVLASQNGVWVTTTVTPV